MNSKWNKTKDRCIVTKVKYNSKEEQLRRRLYNLKQKYQEGGKASEVQKDDKSEGNTDPFGSLQCPENLFDVAREYQIELSNQADVKMGKFIDEMRSEFNKTSDSCTIPQHILHQHTNMLEKQVNLLEDSQKALTELMANNWGQTRSSGYSIKEEIQRENRMMMNDIIEPLNQRCMEMKHLHESTKAWSNGMSSKIEDLKNIIGSSNYANTSFMQQNLQAAPVVQPWGNSLDPEVYATDLDNIRSQMEDIRNHGIAIERNFEKRHHEMTQENLQKKYLPKTITQEVEETRKKQHRNPQITEILTESDKTRKAVENKLGGEFDYGDFEFGLDDILSGKDSILKDFRKAKLDAPPSAPETSIRYNFKTRPVRPKPKPMPQI